MKNRANTDVDVVAGFGREWAYFDQRRLGSAELESAWRAYFAIFPFDKLPPRAVGFDLGCGSGRWAKMVSPRVGTLHCIDASAAALEVARRNLADADNCVFHHASVDAIPLPDGSMDFGYSLGVLHHVPDTGEGIKACVAKLRPGAPFLVYLYYAFDNRRTWFRALWRVTEPVRYVLSRSPWVVRLAGSQMVAAFVYFPLARLALLAEKAGLGVESFPLANYRHRSFYTMRTDALDRFGTRLEQRFTREEIRHMLEQAGLADVRFSDDPPFWCALGVRK